jgi:uncharacterized protein YbcC (UPF0753/DUF2309 family)
MASKAIALIDSVFITAQHFVSQYYFSVVDDCNTPCYGSPNLSLITVISGLGMHDATGLIHSESSQRYFLI